MKGLPGIRRAKSSPPWWRSRVSLVRLLISAGLAYPALACAQFGYPVRPLTIVVPFATASGADINARMLAKQWSEMLGQNIIVENKPGANGAIGAQAVARAKPDGYTLLLGSATTNAANYAFFAGKLPYSAKDFQVVATLGAAPIVLWTGIDTAAASIQEIVAAARAAPGKLTCGAGNSVTQVACEVFKKRFSVDVQTVLYKSNPQSLNDLSSGQISYAFTDPSVAVQYVAQRRIKAIAVASDKRLPNFAQTATFAEQGISDFQISAWTALFAPAGVSADIVARLNEAARAAGALEESIKLRERSGSIELSWPVAQAVEFVAAEIERWQRYVRQSGVAPE